MSLSPPSLLSPSLLFPIASFCVAFLLEFGLNWLALIPWRRSVGKHWTERARLLFPARRSAATLMSLITGFIWFLGYITVPDSFLSVGLLCFSGAELAMFFFNRELNPCLRFGSWLRDVVGDFLLSSRWLFPVFVATIVEIPPDFSLTTGLVALGFCLWVLADGCGLGVRLSVWSGLLLPAGEKLNALIADVSRRTGMPVSGAWIMRSSAANAYACMSPAGWVIFTEGLLSTLSDEEIGTVCAHELEHFSDSRRMLFARIAVLGIFLACVLMKPTFAFGSGESVWLVISICVGLVSLAGSLMAPMLRGMEERADRTAVDTQFDAGVYARALARIYEADQIPAVMPQRSFGAHPDLYDRMTAAGVTPDFPRPPPPERWALQGLAAAAVWIAILVAAVTAASNVGR